MTAAKRVPARPSATVVIVRDDPSGSPEGLQVLLTIRPRHFRFMGGAAVFPGGAVDEEDLDERWAEASTRPPSEATEGGMEKGPLGLGYLVCALREAFEEVGFIIASGPVERLERASAHESGRFLQRCLELGVVLHTDRLVPAGRWVTPLPSDLRFDTRFFLARAPDGWEPRPHPDEVDGCRWSSPEGALEEVRRAVLEMAPPTIDTLQRLERFGSVDEAMAAAVRGALGGSASPPAARLSPVVRAVLAPNPGPLTGPGTNTYIVGRETTCVIDPGVDDPGFIDSVCDASGDVMAVLVTHRHPDHVGGVRAVVQRTEAPVRALGGEPAGGVPVIPLQDEERIELPDATLRTVLAPGHASDHVCFVLEEERSLFSGDNILGEGTSIIAPPDGDMRAYLQSLRRLARLDIDRIYPGHFEPLDEARRVIESYLEHRAERARLIVVALGESGATLEQVVASAYADTPTEMHPYAERSALAHLEMLGAEGRVSRRGSLWVRDG